MWQHVPRLAPAPEVPADAEHSAIKAGVCAEPVHPSPPAGKGQQQQWPEAGMIRISTALCFQVVLLQLFSDTGCR
jgi:hypothetical protein